MINHKRFPGVILSLQVTFIGSNIPVHPHVYSNGHICLSILTDDWYVPASSSSQSLSLCFIFSLITNDPHGLQVTRVIGAIRVSQHIVDAEQLSGEATPAGQRDLRENLQ